MPIQQRAVYKRFRHSLDSVSKSGCYCRFCRIPLLNRFSCVPVIAVTLNQQVKTWNVKIKHESLPHGKFRDNVHAFRFHRLPNLALNRRFPLTPAVAAERAEPAPGFQLRRRAPEFLSAGFTCFQNRRPTRARDRAFLITMCVRKRNAKLFATLWAYLGYLTASTLTRTVDPWASSCSSKREFPPTPLARQRRLPLLIPHLLSRAGPTRRTIIGTSGLGPWFNASTRLARENKYPTRARTFCSVLKQRPAMPHHARATTFSFRAVQRRPFFSAIRTSVSVLFSQSVNLIDRLAFRSGPLGCFEHLSGSLILTRMSL